MKTYVGISDRLFGKWVKMQLPQPDGSIKEVPVTEKWLAKMQGEKKMSQVAQVHIWDVRCGMSAMDFLMEGPGDPFRIEQWTIGKQISQTQYDRFRDKNGDLYVSVNYKEGEPEQILLSKPAWDELMRRFEAAK